MQRWTGNFCTGLGSEILRMRVTILEIGNAQGRIDMSVRNFVEKTRNDYIRHVRTLTAFLGRSPDTVTPEDGSVDHRRHPKPCTEGDICGAAACAGDNAQSVATTTAARPPLIASCPPQPAPWGAGFFAFTGRDVVR